MNTQMLLITAFSLSMDAFAVSISNGLCYSNVSPVRNSLSSGLCFGLFQGIMPLLGYLTGSLFSGLVTNIDHWIALILLGTIGIKMIYDGYQERKNPEVCKTIYSGKTLLLQGVATSIDAFAVGIGFAVMQINIFLACALIAVITFAFSFLGVHIGRRFGSFFRDKAQFAGGIILCLIGFNIFYEHVFA